jgi:hypothetical protein
MKARPLIGTVLPFEGSSASTMIAPVSWELVPA